MLQERRALVTGSAKRVGRAIALELARAGCHIAVHYRQSKTEALQTVDAIRAMGRRAVALEGDLADSAVWSQFVDSAMSQLGGLDVLVNNASAFLTPIPDTIEDFSIAQWDDMLRINLTAPAGLSHAARPHLIKSGRGRILNLTDISAQRPWKNHLAYCVSKAGLNALTSALATALAPEVAVNGLALGIAAFPDVYPEEQRERLTRRVPMQRPSSPEDVARFARLILESDSFLTGQVIAFDGGRSQV